MWCVYIMGQLSDEFGGALRSSCFLLDIFAAICYHCCNTMRFSPVVIRLAPCGLRGCKNGPAPFPGRMSYKATKPGLVFVLYLSMFFYCVGVY